MSKELVAILFSTAAILAGIIAILAFLWIISNDVRDIRSDLGELHGITVANSEGIKELRHDVREVRGIVTSHLDGHTPRSNISTSAIN